ncbi:hypothetical protein [Sphingomicrobium sediminis]|uniref:Uncharacterized protein n=1 Tax=Sphingomicrobium sediminis TaxID=2950949 RepID=A0A9X2J2I4_9SPHN|nr:hypothetical protein [Sphingomicrobium sediminis]MCM8557814.1 hypothetical protein [Sphingomicrobium sediminis]
MMPSGFWNYFAFAFFVALGAGAWFAVGAIYSSAQAYQLIEALTESGLYLASTGAGASATILALMLTLLGMINRVDAIDFDDGLSVLVKRISKFATLALMLSLLLLLLMVFPIGEYKEIPQKWFGWLFNIMFTMTVLVLASLAMTVTSLYQTIMTVISGFRSVANPEEEVENGG